ncbi:MAG: hypothetical protein GY797_03205 [Deltaproteobacteria bacterium]|nr:hypothetical protein [Deltaproteobacteria bacterium]
MSFWNTFSEFFSRESKKYKTLFLSPEQVDVESDATPFKKGEAYCRVWLVEMRLAKGVEWFTQRYPVVHSSIRFDHGGQKVTIPNLAGPGFLKELTKENLDRIIQCNYPLTPLFPFNRGLVELQAGLFSMITNDQVGNFMNTLCQFSKLLPVPELSSVLKLADPVYDGIQNLLGVSDGRLELGYQQTFTGMNGGGSNTLTPGYFVAILAEASEIDDNTLCIVNDSLRIRTQGETEEFKGYSYMLFRLEKSPNQDWESLTRIKEQVYQAQEAVVKGENEQAKKILTAIKIAVFQSADLTKADKRQMVLKIEAELKEWGLEATKGPISEPSLYAIMQRSLPTIDSETEGELEVLEKFFDRN